MLLAPITGFAQDGKTKALEMHELQFADIPGAVTFTQPEFIKLNNGELISIAKYGNAYPTVFDYDNDGLNDLLVGEFGGGDNANLLVYKNVGTASAPEYAEAFYATDTKGDKLYILGS